MTVYQSFKRRVELAKTLGWTERHFSGSSRFFDWFPPERKPVKGEGIMLPSLEVLEQQAKERGLQSSP